MPMAPDDSVNIALVNVALLKDLIDILRNIEARNSSLDAFDNGGSEVPPVFPRSKIEHHTASRLRVFDIECKGGQVECLMALDGGLDERGCGYHDVAGSVDDLNFDC